MPMPTVRRPLQDRATRAQADRSRQSRPSNQFHSQNSNASQESTTDTLSLSQLSNAQRVTRAQARNIVTLPPSHAADDKALRAIGKIEFIFERIFDKIADGSTATELLIPHWTRPSRRRRQDTGDDDPEAGAPLAAQPAFRWIRFPGTTPVEAKRFAGMLCILRFAHEAMLSGTPVTKRNIFYQNPELFESQRAVDELVDDIAYTLSVGRDTLNIVATAKGLVAGNLSLGMRDGSVISCASETQSGVLIPPLSTIGQMDFGAARWLLVIEKDATFTTLSASRFYEASSAGPGILVTAKGYPDLSTREFLHTIHTSRPRLPILGLFDFDPDGIAIMRIYKYGSLKLGHEERCRVPGMRWIGMKGDDICLRPGYSRSSGQAIDHQSSSQALTQLEHQQRSSHMSSDVSSPLSARDRSMAASLLGAICGKPDASDEDLEQKRELQVMLMLGVKAEMQAVDHLGNIAGWLDERLRSALQ